ncbi:MAG: hypothetical protein JWO45_202 [Spartobacteria bacterium]|nr:hypothetical protein [Spartobacteria bacterium]
MDDIGQETPPELIGLSALEVRIFDVVTQHGPIRAPEITAHLSSTPDWQLKKSINRALYGPLARLLTRNDAYAWSPAVRQTAGRRAETRQSPTKATVENGQDGRGLSPLPATHPGSPDPMPSSSVTTREGIHLGPPPAPIGRLALVRHISDVTQLRGSIDKVTRLPDGHIVVQFRGSQGAKSYFVLDAMGLMVIGPARHEFFSRASANEGVVVNSAEWEAEATEAGEPSPAPALVHMPSLPVASPSISNSDCNGAACSPHWFQGSMAARSDPAPTAREDAAVRSLDSQRQWVLSHLVRLFKQVLSAKVTVDESLLLSGRDAGADVLVLERERMEADSSSVSGLVCNAAPGSWQTRTLASLNLDPSVLVALRRAGLHTLGAIAARSDSALLGFHGVGPKTVTTLRAHVLAAREPTAHEARAALPLCGEAADLSRPQGQEDVPVISLAGALEPNHSQQGAAPGSWKATPLDSLEIDPGVRRALRRAGLHTLGAIAARSDDVLLGFRGVGPRTVATLRAHVLARGEAKSTEAHIASPLSANPAEPLPLGRPQIVPSTPSPGAQDSSQARQNSEHVAWQTITLESLELDRSMLAALKRVGLSTLGFIASRSNDELLDLPGVGPLTVHALRALVLGNGGPDSDPGASAVAAEQIDHEWPDASSTTTENGPIGGTVIYIPEVVHGVLLEKLELTTRPFACLSRAGIVTLGDLNGRTWESMLAIRSMGSKSVDEVAERLRSLIRKAVPFPIDESIPAWNPEVQGDYVGRFEIPEPLRPMPLELIGLQVRTYNGLIREGVVTVGHLHGHTWEFVRAIRHFGVGSVQDLAARLVAAFGVGAHLAPMPGVAGVGIAIADISLCESAQAALERAGITQVTDLAAHSTKEILELPGFQPLLLNALLRALWAQGWSPKTVFRQARQRDHDAAQEPTWRGPRDVLVWLMSRVYESRFVVCMRYYGDDDALQTIADESGRTREQVRKSAHKGLEDCQGLLEPLPTWRFLRKALLETLKLLVLVTPEGFYALVAEDLGWAEEPLPEDLNALRCLVAMQGAITMLKQADQIAFCSTKAAARSRLEQLQSFQPNELTNDHALVACLPERFRPILLGDIGRLIVREVRKPSVERALVEVLQMAGKPLPLEVLIATARQIPGVRAQSERSFYQVITDRSRFRRFARGVYGLPEQEISAADIEQIAHDWQEARVAMPLEDAGTEFGDATSRKPSTTESTTWDKLSIFAGTDPADGSVMLVEASKLIIERANQCGLLQRPWSLAELCATEGDYQWLCAWAQALEYSRVRQYLEAGSRYMEAVGLLLMMLAAEAGRRFATEGTLWSAVHPLLGADVRRLLFVGGQPTQSHKDALERAARRHNLRHVFGEVSTQSWVVTVYLQFGFTRRGVKRRLPEWLVGQAQTQAIKTLLEASSGSESFQKLWRELRVLRQQAPSATGLAALPRSPWVLPDWRDDIQAAARQGIEAGAGETPQRRPVERSTFLAVPLLSWEEGKAPVFKTALTNVGDLDLSDHEYRVFVGGQPAAMLVRQADGSYKSIPAAAISLPGDRPTVLVQLVGTDGSIIQGEHLDLWDAEDEVTAFKLPEGVRVDAWTKTMDPAKSYILRLSPDLTVEPSSPSIFLGGNGRPNWAMLRGPWPTSQTARLGSEEIWAPILATRQPTSKPSWATQVVGVQVAGGAENFGLETVVEVRIPPDTEVLSARIAGNDRPLRRLSDTCVRLEVPVPFGRGYDRTARVTLKLRRGTELARVTLGITLAGKGAAILRPDGWQPLSDTKMLSVADALCKISILPPSTWNRQAVEWGEWAIVEGSVWRDRPGRLPQPIRHLAGLGAPLAVRYGRYNAEGNVLTLARSVIDPGGIVGVTMDDSGGLVAVNLVHPSEVDNNHQFVVWTADAAIHRAPPAEMADAAPIWRPAKRILGRPVAVAISYAGARVGAWWAPDWSQALESVPPSSSGTVAAWIRWMALPVLAPEHLANTRKFACNNATQVLPAWLLAGSAPEGLEFDPSKSEAWLAAVREIYGRWSIGPAQATALVDGLAVHAATEPPKVRVEIACHVVARAHPLLMGRLLLAWGHAPENRAFVSDAIEFVILGMLGGETVESLERQCATGLEVDPFFLRRSLIEYAVGQLHDATPVVRSVSNLSLAVSALEPFRRLLAVRFAIEVRDRGGIPMNMRS